MILLRSPVAAGETDVKNCPSHPNSRLVMPESSGNFPPGGKITKYRSQVPDQIFIFMSHSGQRPGYHRAMMNKWPDCKSMRSQSQCVDRCDILQIWYFHFPVDCSSELSTYFLYLLLFSRLLIKAGELHPNVTTHYGNIITIRHTQIWYYDVSNENESRCTYIDMNKDNK